MITGGIGSERIDVDSGGGSQTIAGCRSLRDLSPPNQATVTRSGDPFPSRPSCETLPLLFFPSHLPSSSPASRNLIFHGIRRTLKLLVIMKKP